MDNVSIEMNKPELNIPCIHEAMKHIPEGGFLVWLKEFPMSVKAYARSENISCPRHVAEDYALAQIDIVANLPTTFDVMVFSDRKDSISEFRVSLSCAIKAERVKDDA